MSTTPAWRTAYWQARAEHWARVGNHKLQAFCSKQAAFWAAKA